MMRKIEILLGLSLTLILCPPPVLGQDAEQPAGGENAAAAAGKSAPPDSQAVDASEDNYRRFMELKDDRIKRGSLPLAAYEAPTDSERLGTLPEASQKHLRNQLREVILANGRWTPGTAKVEHPYVPSEAALKDPQLKRREASAWAELLEKYNEREAQNYARNQAARSGQPGQRNGDQKEPGEKQGRQATTAGQQTQGERPGERERGEGYAPPGGPDDDAASTAGVSQSALEFLQRNHPASLTAGTAGAASPAQPPRPAGTQTVAGRNADQQSAAVKAHTGQSASQQSSASQQAQNSQSASQQSSASQQAQNSQSASQQAAAQESRDGDKDNDSEPSEDGEKKKVEFNVRARDTLSVKDLANARGVSVSETAPKGPAPRGKGDDGQ